MFYGKLRRQGNSYVVTIPKDEVERVRLQEGQLLAINAQPVEMRPALPDDLREALESSWERNRDGYEYMADR